MEGLALAQGITPAYMVACSSSPSPSLTAGPSAVQTDGAASTPSPPLRERLSVDVKDVTGRYTSSMLALQKLRDGQWWESLLEVLSGTRARSIASTSPHSTLPVYNSLGSRPHRDASITPSSVDALAIAAGPPSSGPSRADGAIAGATQHPPLPSSVHRPPADREDEELKLRVASQLQCLPTSIEGFKTHPLYVLKRHLTKYQTLRPGTSLLGTHKVKPWTCCSINPH